jgi:hypothetical protein
VQFIIQRIAERGDSECGGLRIVSFCSHSPFLQFLEALSCPSFCPNGITGHPLDGSLFVYTFRLTYFLVGPLLRTHSRCRGLLLQMITLGRSPLDESSAHPTHNIHKRQISMPPTGFETAIPASVRPRTYTLNRVAISIGSIWVNNR